MITAIIPTLNEECCIGEAIQSVSFADEILVIDSFSSDRTTEIAKAMGARIIQRAFDDFSSQKNYALSQATHQWVLVIDADERVSPELREEIIRTVEQSTEEVAYYVYRNFYFEGRRIHYGGWQTDKVIRLFRRDSCRYNGNLVHETIVSRGPVGYLENRLDHFSYRSREQYAAKLEKYAELQARQLYNEKKTVNAPLVAVKPPFRFFVHYFFRLGLLDGIPGWILAYEHASGVRKRYSYLKRRYANSREDE